MFCKKCGSKITDEALFCAKCGCDLRAGFDVRNTDKMEPESGSPDMDFKADSMQNKGKSANHRIIIFTAIGIILSIAAVSAVLIIRTKLKNSDTDEISVSSGAANNSPSYEMDVTAPSSDMHDMKEAQVDNSISPVYNDEAGSMDIVNNTLSESSVEEFKADIKMEDIEATEESNENDKEKIIVADGYYETDTDFIGNLSEDGRELTITTALGHFESDQNSRVIDYERNTFLLPVSESCRCTIDVEETTLAEVLDYVIDGINTHDPKSGVSFDLKVQNGEIVFLGLYS